MERSGGAAARLGIHDSTAGPTENDNNRQKRFLTPFHLLATSAVLGNSRVQGGLQATVGAAQISGALAAAEIPIVGPFITGLVGLRGLDNLTAGFSQLVSGNPQQTKTGRAFERGLEQYGVDPLTAQNITGFAETNVDIISLFTGALPGPRFGPRAASSATLRTAPEVPTIAPSQPQNLSVGNLFNRARANRYDFQEIYVENAAGVRFRVDSYNPAAGEIVSRKFTQLSEVSTKTATSYIREAAKKYSPGSRIADVPSSGSLAGQMLQGNVYLEVPIQVNPVPKAVLNAASKQGVIIRDVNGRIYTP